MRRGDPDPQATTPTWGVIAAILVLLDAKRGEWVTTVEIAEATKMDEALIRHYGLRLDEVEVSYGLELDPATHAVSDGAETVRFRLREVSSCE